MLSIFIISVQAVINFRNFYIFTKDEEWIPPKTEMTIEAFLVGGGSAATNEGYGGGGGYTISFLAKDGNSFDYKENDIFTINIGSGGKFNGAKEGEDTFIELNHEQYRANGSKIRNQIEGTNKFKAFNGGSGGAGCKFGFEAKPGQRGQEASGDFSGISQGSSTFPFGLDSDAFGPANDFESYAFNVISSKFGIDYSRGGYTEISEYAETHQGPTPKSGGKLLDLINLYNIFLTPGQEFEESYDQTTSNGNGGNFSYSCVTTPNSSMCDGSPGIAILRTTPSCPAGYYIQLLPIEDSNANLTKPTLKYNCQECSPGTYSDGWSKQCTDCPQSLYSVKGTSQCTENCPPGYYKNDATRACEPCKTNTFSNGQGNSCDLCPLGQQQNSTGNGCFPCSQSNGEHFDSINLKCERCPPGSYAESPMDSTCIGCDSSEGEISGGGYEKCHKCPSGTYAAVVTCLTCPPHTYSSEGSLECFKCQPGQGPKTNFSGCEDCDYGYYSIDGICLKCPMGSYSNQKGATKCVLLTPTASTGMGTPLQTEIPPPATNNGGIPNPTPIASESFFGYPSMSNFPTITQNGDHWPQQTKLITPTVSNIGEIKSFPSQSYWGEIPPNSPTPSISFYGEQPYPTNSPAQTELSLPPDASVNSFLNIISYSKTITFSPIIMFQPTLTMLNSYSPTISFSPSQTVYVNPNEPGEVIPYTKYVPQKSYVFTHFPGISMVQGVSFEAVESNVEFLREIPLFISLMTSTKSENQINIIIGLSVSAVVLLAIILILFALKFQAIKKKGNEEGEVEEMKEETIVPASTTGTFTLTQDNPLYENAVYGNQDDPFKRDFEEDIQNQILSTSTIA